MCWRAKKRCDKVDCKQGHSGQLDDRRKRKQLPCEREIALIGGNFTSHPQVASDIQQKTVWRSSI